MTPTLTDLFASPDHYLHSFAGEDAVFVPMDAPAYRRSIFLDGRIEPAGPGALRVPIDTLLAAPTPPPPGTAWIFHVAHCGSTLLARALEQLTGALVLREPLALRQVAVSDAGALLPLTLAMLAKRYPGAGPTVVKANVPVNFILPDIAALAPGAPAILLHYGWRQYLLAILRSDTHRQWLRSVTGELADRRSDLGGVGDPAELGDPRLGDAERAAALWLAQTRLFAQAAAEMPNARVVDADAFFARPADTLAAASALFGMSAADAAAAAVAGGALFTTYSKNPQAPFANADRLARQQAAERDLAPELARAEAWLARGDAQGLQAVLAQAALIA